MQKFLMIILTIAVLILAVTYGQVLVLQQTVAAASGTAAHFSTSDTIFQNIWLSMLIGLFISGLCSSVVMLLYYRRRKTYIKSKNDKE